jgi:hypothetical protein
MAQLSSIGEGRRKTLVHVVELSSYGDSIGRSTSTTPVYIVPSLMQSFEMCDATSTSRSIWVQRNFRLWEIVGGKRSSCMWSSPHHGDYPRPHRFVGRNAFDSFARLIENPELRSNKPNPAPTGDPTMAKTPVVPHLLLNSVVVPVERQRGSKPIKARPNFLQCEQTTFAVAMTKLFMRENYYCAPSVGVRVLRHPKRRRLALLNMCGILLYCYLRRI